MKSKIIYALLIIVCTSCSRKIATTKFEYNLPSETKVVEPGWNKTSTRLTENYPFYTGLAIGVGLPLVPLSSGHGLKFGTFAITTVLAIAAYKALRSVQGNISDSKSGKARPQPQFHINQKDKWVRLYNKQTKTKYQVLRENPDGISFIMYRPQKGIDILPIDKDDFFDCINISQHTFNSTSFNNNRIEHVFSIQNIYVSSINEKKALSDSLGLKAEKILSPCFIHHDVLPSLSSLAFYKSKNDTKPFAYYSGRFQNGIPNGYGSFIYADPNIPNSTSYVQEGIFKSGRYAQTKQAGFLADQLVRTIDYKSLFGIAPPTEYLSNRIIISQLHSKDSDDIDFNSYNLRFISDVTINGAKHWLDISASKDIYGKENLELNDADEFLRTEYNESRKKEMIEAQIKRNEELQRTRSETGGAEEFNDYVAIKKVEYDPFNFRTCYRNPDVMYTSPFSPPKIEDIFDYDAYYETWGRKSKQDNWVRIGVWKVIKRETCDNVYYDISLKKRYIPNNFTLTMEAVYHQWQIFPIISQQTILLIEK